MNLAKPKRCLEIQLTRCHTVKVVFVKAKHLKTMRTFFHLVFLIINYTIVVNKDKIAKINALIKSSIIIL